MGGGMWLWVCGGVRSNESTWGMHEFAYVCVCVHVCGGEGRVTGTGTVMNDCLGHVLPCLGHAIPVFKSPSSPPPFPPLPPSRPIQTRPGVSPSASPAELSSAQWKALWDAWQRWQARLIAGEFVATSEPGSGR